MLAVTAWLAWGTFDQNIADSNPIDVYHEWLYMYMTFVYCRIIYFRGFKILWISD